MAKGAKMTELDMRDVHRNSERVKEYYQRLGELAAQMYQASDGDGDQTELDRLTKTIRHEHAKCGASLKAIYRLVG